MIRVEAAGGKGAEAKRHPQTGFSAIVRGPGIEFLPSLGCSLTWLPEQVSVF